MACPAPVPNQQPPVRRGWPTHASAAVIATGGRSGLHRLARSWLNVRGRRTPSLERRGGVVGPVGATARRGVIVGIAHTGDQSVMDRRLLLDLPTLVGCRMLDVVRAVIGTKPPLLLQDLPESGQSWRVRYAIFSRTGLSEAAAQELGKRHQAERSSGHGVQAAAQLIVVDLRAERTSHQGCCRRRAG